MKLLVIFLAASVGFCATPTKYRKGKTRVVVVKKTDEKVIDRVIVKTLRSEP